jgi:hypothetical protein
MTEPDPVAALAAQLEELRGQLARSQGEVGQLRAQLDGLSGQDLKMLLAIKQLSEKLDAMITQREAEYPQAPYWLGLSREDYAAQLGEVQEWVERVARVQWPGYMDKLPRCWANHREAVWELSNLMTEFGRIYGDPDNQPLADALWFFERWLPDVLSRLAQAIKCDVTGCRLMRSSPWERSPPRYS